MVILAKLVACESDSLGYVTYVFKRLEDCTDLSKYVMCIKFPNWESKTIKLGDEGYLQYSEIRAGVDKWYDGTQMVPYNYNTVQFLKFVEKPNEDISQYIM